MDARIQKHAKTRLANNIYKSKPFNIVSNSITRRVSCEACHVLSYILSFGYVTACPNIRFQ